LSFDDKLASSQRQLSLILPGVNRFEVCKKAESAHRKANHQYNRDASISEWRGWHAARRGLGSNLHRLGVPEIVIQRILRRTDVSTTATYYIKTAADDVRDAMTKLEYRIAEPDHAQSDTSGTVTSRQSNVSTKLQ